MEKLSYSKQNTRLRTALELLMRKHEVTSIDKLSEKIKFGRSYLSEMMNGTKPITDKFLNKLKYQEGVNDLYIRNGSLPIMYKEFLEAPNVRESVKAFHNYLVNNFRGMDQDTVPQFVEDQDISEEYTTDSLLSKIKGLQKENSELRQKNERLEVSLLNQILDYEKNQLHTLDYIRTSLDKLLLASGVQLDADVNEIRALVDSLDNSSKASAADQPDRLPTDNSQRKDN